MHTLNRINLGAMLLITALIWTATACEPQPQPETPDEPDEPMEEVALPDTSGASMWAYLQDADYQEWPQWPGKTAYYQGQDPHGMLLTTYANDAAYQAIDGKAGMMPTGAIIVKENYMPDSSLAAVTVMYKASAGYNADHNDWFFSKHKADGSLDMTPDGMAMEGRLTGCQNCHGAQKANDYLFTGMIR